MRRRHFLMRLDYRSSTSRADQLVGLQHLHFDSPTGLVRLSSRSKCRLSACAAVCAVVGASVVRFTSCLHGTSSLVPAPASLSLGCRVISTRRLAWRLGVGSIGGDVRRARRAQPARLVRSRSLRTTAMPNNREAAPRTPNTIGRTRVVSVTGQSRDDAASAASRTL